MPGTQRSHKTGHLHNLGVGKQQVRHRGGNRLQRVQHHGKRQRGEPGSFRKPHATGERRVCTAKRTHEYISILFIIKCGFSISDRYFSYSY